MFRSFDTWIRWVHFRCVQVGSGEGAHSGVKKNRRNSNECIWEVLQWEVGMQCVIWNPTAYTASHHTQRGIELLQYHMFHVWTLNQMPLRCMELLERTSTSYKVIITSRGCFSKFTCKNCVADLNVFHLDFAPLLFVTRTISEDIIQRINIHNFLSKRVYVIVDDEILFEHAFWWVKVYLTGICSGISCGIIRLAPTHFFKKQLGMTL